MHRVAGCSVEHLPVRYRYSDIVNGNEGVNICYGWGILITKALFAPVLQIL